MSTTINIETSAESDKRDNGAKCNNIEKNTITLKRNKKKTKLLGFDLIATYLSLMMSTTVLI